jgi:hypothetical protein
MALSSKPGESIIVTWFIDAEVITNPEEQARVSTATARRAVEYVETGQRCSAACRRCGSGFRP